MKEEEAQPGRETRGPCRAEVGGWMRCGLERCLREQMQHQLDQWLLDQTGGARSAWSTVSKGASIGMVHGEPEVCQRSSQVRSRSFRA